MAVFNADMTATVINSPITLYNTPNGSRKENRSLRNVKINIVDDKTNPSWFHIKDYSVGWAKKEDLTDISGTIEGEQYITGVVPSAISFRVKNPPIKLFKYKNTSSESQQVQFRYVLVDAIEGNWYHVKGQDPGWARKFDLILDNTGDGETGGGETGGGETGGGETGGGTSIETVDNALNFIVKENMEYTSRQLEKDINTQLYEAQLAGLQVATGTEDLAISEDEFANTILVNNLNGIYGIPYQFMASVDQRLGDESSVGRKYAEKIISKMPLLCVTPGKPDFMSNFSKGEKKGILAALLDGTPEQSISDIVTKSERYFTFVFAYDEYFNYVNALCRAGARFLNISDLEVDIGDGDGPLSDFDWGLALNSKLKATYSGQEFIGFYMDSTDSVSESFSNNTTKSQLEGITDSVSEMGRELGFLIGSAAGREVTLLDEASLSQTREAIDGLTSKFLDGGIKGILNNIADTFATVATGAKLMFPEIWADSEFSRNFSIDIKLRTPDGDSLSWYLNIYVPLCHLIALAAGHQTDNVNGYYSPFLIRANYKGLFNVDMGIITSLNITKGKEAAWNVDGLPTEVNVSIDIKDLYGMLAIVPNNDAKTFVSNNILMDYIANTCGININQMDLVRSVEIYLILQKSRIVNLPNTFQRKFQDVVDKYAKNAYDRVLNDFLI